MFHASKPNIYIPIIPNPSKQSTDWSFPPTKKKSSSSSSPLLECGRNQKLETWARRMKTWLPFPSFLTSMGSSMGSSSMRIENRRKSLLSTFITLLHFLGNPSFPRICRVPTRGIWEFEIWDIERSVLCKLAILQTASVWEFFGVDPTSAPSLVLTYIGSETLS